MVSAQLRRPRLSARAQRAAPRSGQQFTHGQWGHRRDHQRQSACRQLKLRQASLREAGVVALAHGTGAGLAGSAARGRPGRQRASRPGCPALPAPPQTLKILELGSQRGTGTAASGSLPGTGVSQQVHASVGADQADPQVPLDGKQRGRLMEERRGWLKRQEHVGYLHGQGSWQPL